MKVDLKAAVATIASFIYAFGVLAVQVHLLRYGILDLSLLHVRYFVVGLWFIFTLTPAILLILLTELRLANAARRSVILELTVTLGIALVTIFVNAWLYPLKEFVFDFNAYPYPKWYILLNVAWFNAAPITAWLIGVIVRWRGASLRTSRLVGSSTAIVLLLACDVFFGRTVYSALARGVGGGAPQFARICTESGNLECLLIHQSGDAFFLIGLAAHPVEIERRRPSDQLSVLSSSPVRPALTKNELIMLPNDKVKQVTIYGFSAEAALNQHLPLSSKRRR
jgi:hypothetical protein